MTSCSSVGRRLHQLRGHLLNERSIDRELLSISGYWRRGADEDTLQAEKLAAT